MSVHIVESLIFTVRWYLVYFSFNPVYVLVVWHMIADGWYQL